MKKINLTLIVLMILIPFAASYSDVIIKHKSNMDIASIMSTTVEGTEYIKSDRSMTDSKVTITNSLIPFMSKGKPQQTENITRLDKLVLWEINNDKKTYKETPLASIKETLKQTEEGEAPPDTEKSDYTWTVEVKTIDQPQTINGFECKGVIGKATGVNTRDPRDTMFVTNEQWRTQNAPGADEMTEYQKNYAKAAGIDEMMAQQGMDKMMSQYGGQFQMMAPDMEKVPGYPIKMAMTVESSLASQGNKESMDKGEGGDDGSQEVMNKLGGLFGKKKKDKSEDKAADQSNTGRQKAFSMTYEILSLEKTTVEDGKFEVPAEYKLKK